MIIHNITRILTNFSNNSLATFNNNDCYTQNDNYTNNVFIPLLSILGGIIVTIIIFCAWLNFGSCSSCWRCLSKHKYNKAIEKLECFIGSLKLNNTPNYIKRNKKLLKIERLLVDEDRITPSNIEYVHKLNETLPSLVINICSIHQINAFYNFFNYIMEEKIINIDNFKNFCSYLFNKYKLINFKEYFTNNYINNLNIVFNINIDEQIIQQYNRTHSYCVNNGKYLIESIIAPRLNFPLERNSPLSYENLILRYNNYYSLLFHYDNNNYDEQNAMILFHFLFKYYIFSIYNNQIHLNNDICEIIKLNNSHSNNNIISINNNSSVRTIPVAQLNERLNIDDNYQEDFVRIIRLDNENFDEAILKSIYNELFQRRMSVLNSSFLNK